MKQSPKPKAKAKPAVKEVKKAMKYSKDDIRDAARHMRDHGG